MRFITTNPSEALTFISWKSNRYIEKLVTCLEILWLVCTTGMIVTVCNKMTNIYTSYSCAFLLMLYYNNCSPLLLPCPPLSQLTSCTPYRYISYLANSLAAAESEPALYRFLTFHVPNLMPIFHCLGCTKGSVQARSTCIRFVTRAIFRVRSC